MHCVSQNSPEWLQRQAELLQGVTAKFTGLPLDRVTPAPFLLKLTTPARRRPDLCAGEEREDDLAEVCAEAAKLKPRDAMEARDASWAKDQIE